VLAALVGISYGWWMNKHSRHHANPNKIGKASMPRPHLRAARMLVREHCRSNDVPYVEASLLSSYRIVIGYLNRVGLAARDPFDCPLASRLRSS
jgi:fatty acid desaturase